MTPRPNSRKGIGGRPRGAPTTVVRMPVPIAKMAQRLAQGTLRAGDINAFLDIQPTTSLTVPLVGARAACGFPSPADDHLDRPLDFNELLVQNPAATFAVRIAGESMTGAGLFPGDIAVVDRSLKPSQGSIVLALIDGEFTIKRYQMSGDGIVLRAENPAFDDIVISEETGLEVWGVLRHSIRML
jgi:DNA polymerase V